VRDAVVARHLRKCLACRRLAGHLAQLEHTWRQQPLPLSAEPARLAFLERLAEPILPLPTRPARRRWVPGRWTAAAALVLLAVGLGALILAPFSQPQPAADVITQLVDWNLELSRAETDADRQRIHESHAVILAQAVQNAGLTDEDQRLAETLLTNGAWLAQHDDPLAEADRFTDLADQLVKQMQTATEHGKEQDLARLTQQYHQITQRGITANLRDVEATGHLDAERQRKLEKIVKQETARQEALGAMLEKASPASHKHINHALNAGHHPPTHKK
jgi:hypothetical protein